MRTPASDPATPSESSAAKVISSSAPEAITVYHWLVVVLASCGWLFDCMGQRIFVLAREPALRELLGATASDDAVRRWGSIATTLMMVGWATGGIVFGMLSDRFGRVKAMVGTLLAYTLFSGLSGFAQSPASFLVWRFLFGLGVGGMFGSATTLLAESVPARFRTFALGSMQALSAVGNMLASLLSLKIIPGRENFWGHFSGWQVLCFASVAPALLAVPMILILKEPEPWKRAKAEAAASGGKRKVGSIADMFQHPRWRHNLAVGVCLGLAGMVGLWGIAFFSPELITTALKHRPLQLSEIHATEVCHQLNSAATPSVRHIHSLLPPPLRQELSQVPPGQPVSAALAESLVKALNQLIQQGTVYDEAKFQELTLKKATKNLLQRVTRDGRRADVISLNRQLIEQSFPGQISELQATIDQTRSRGTFLQDVGSMLGMFTFTFAAAYLSRRTAFLGAFVLCLSIVSFVFYSLKTETDVYWMLPMVGFATLSVFAGYSIYFPEIFPTRLRGTGVGFCYNTVRYLAAPFPFLLGWLSTLMPFRTVAVMMSAIYLVGILALVWAPETKGKPLPED